MTTITEHRCAEWELPSWAPHLRRVTCTCGWTTGYLGNAERAVAEWHGHLAEWGVDDPS